MTPIKLQSSHKTQSHKKMPSKRPPTQKHWKTRKWIIPAIILAIIALVVVVILVMNNKAPSKAVPLPANINVNEAAQRFEEGAYLLDVRTVAEWTEAHIEGAILIPLDQLSTRMGEIPADRDVLIICRTGNRSSEARDLLRAAGFIRTTSVTGGIDSWIASGLPVVTAS